MGRNPADSPVLCAAGRAPFLGWWGWLTKWGSRRRLDPTYRAHVLILAAAGPVPTFWQVFAQPIAVFMAALLAFSAAGLAWDGARRTRAQDRELWDRDHRRVMEEAQGEARRKETATLHTRVSRAAAALGAESLPGRIAGIYALADLADQWYEFAVAIGKPEWGLQQRQACVNIVCAYLRSAPSPRQLEGRNAREQLRFDDPSAGVREAAVEVLARNIRRWRADGALSIDLTSAFLYNAQLAGADLSGAILTHADLRDAHVVGADLSRAVLFGTRLEGAEMLSCDLRGASFDGAHLHDTLLGGSLVLPLKQTHPSLIDFDCWSEGTEWPTGWAPDGLRVCKAEFEGEAALL